MIGMTPAEYAASKRIKYTHKPCCHCHRTEPQVTFSKNNHRCRECDKEASRISKIRTGKRGPTMIGG